MTTTKRCPRCGQVKAAEEFYRRRRDPAAAERLRAVDRVRQRRRRTLAGHEGEDP